MREREGGKRRKATGVAQRVDTYEGLDVDGGEHDVAAVEALAALLLAQSQVTGGLCPLRVCFICFVCFFVVG